MVEASDDMNRHPRSNSTHVARFERAILLLEIPHRLIGAYGGEADQSQHEEQKQDEQAQLDTFTWRNQFQVALVLALTKSSKKIYRVVA